MSVLSALRSSDPFDGVGLGSTPMSAVSLRRKLDRKRSERSEIAAAIREMGKQKTRNQRHKKNDNSTSNNNSNNNKNNIESLSPPTRIEVFHTSRLSRMGASSFSVAAQRLARGAKRRAEGRRMERTPSPAEALLAASSAGSEGEASSAGEGEGSASGGTLARTNDETARGATQEEEEEEGDSASPLPILHNPMQSNAIQPFLRVRTVKGTIANYSGLWAVADMPKWLSHDLERKKQEQIFWFNSLVELWGEHGTAGRRDDVDEEIGYEAGAGDTLGGGVGGGRRLVGGGNIANRLDARPLTVVAEGGGKGRPGFSYGNYDHSEEGEINETSGLNRGEGFSGFSSSGIIYPSSIHHNLPEMVLSARVNSTTSGHSMSSLSTIFPGPTSSFRPWTMEVDVLLADSTDETRPSGADLGSDSTDVPPSDSTDSSFDCSPDSDCSVLGFDPFVSFPPMIVAHENSTASSGVGYIHGSNHILIMRYHINGLREFRRQNVLLRSEAQFPNDCLTRHTTLISDNQDKKDPIFWVIGNSTGEAFED